MLKNVKSIHLNNEHFQFMITFQFIKASYCFFFMIQLLAHFNPFTANHK